MIKRALLCTLAFVLCFSVSPFYAATASAADPASWRAGNIIDDALFTDKNSMSVQEIQNFLNNMVGTGYYGRADGQCDTYGQGTSEFGGGTRAQWAAANGYPTTFTCLKDYYEVPKTSPGNWLPANNYGGKPIPGGAISAAQMIHSAAQQYNISPKVLLVTIHKESAGPLTTDDWPLEKQYTYAMGAHCPDSGPGGSANCDPNYAGFSMQISESAGLMRWYLDNMDQPWWSYKKLGNNSILYNPNSSCGASNVSISSSATAALYTYTPYQPNAAALANLYGTGDGCSAYGNRNFWRIFSDWFGSTRVPNLPGCYEATNTTRSCVWLLNSPSGNPYYTSSVGQRDHLVNVAGYQYQGRVLFGNVVAHSGNIPVYRLDKPNGGSFITTDKNEYDSLVTAGWTAGGIDFYADPPYKNSGYPVYRLYSSSNGTHRWSINGDEMNNLISSGYVVENMVFTSISAYAQETTPPSGRMLVYRFYIPQSHSHMWTTDIYERDGMISAGYRYEGVAWHSMSSDTTKPVYRLYAPSLRQHLYTTDVNEKNNLAASGGWNYEGVSFYVNPSGTTPVYRLYAPSLGVHHLTLDAHERSTLLNSGGWQNEGTAWQQ